MPKTTYEGPSFEEGHEPPGVPAGVPVDLDPANGPAVTKAAAAPEAEATPEPPPPSAPKAEHVEYVAEALGVPREEAESMTKPDLVELARNPEPAPEDSAPKDSAPKPAPKRA